MYITKLKYKQELVVSLSSKRVIHFYINQRKRGDRDIVSECERWYNFSEVKNVARKVREKSSSGIYHSNITRD